MAKHKFKCENCGSDKYSMYLDEPTGRFIIVCDDCGHEEF